MATLELTLRIAGDGWAADDVLAELMVDAQGGELDQGVLNVIRGHLSRYTDERDWRIVGVSVRPGDGEA